VPPLPLPALRLMVPPLRLVSAAIWQTIQQSHVMDYGMLEEFVTMVTDVVPELLNDSQRAQLILGLRARLVLELCRSKPYHLGCPDLRQHLYSVFKADAEVGLSESSFLGLVQTLLKDPDEREHFFQDVFPVEFGSSYDAAIQKLMWQFLSRLEKLLPVSNFQQVLVEIQLYRGTMGTKTFSLFKVSFIYPLPFLDTLSSSDGDCILSALCLPPVERVVIATEQTDSETHVSSLNVFIDTFTKELEVDSATLAKYTEMEPGTNMDVIEKASSVINEEDNSEFAETEEVEPVLVLGEDGKMAPLIKTNKLKGLKRDRNDTGGMPDGKKHRTPKPVRRNRGLCGRVLSRFSDMKKHMQTHKNGRTYQCRNCQKTFKHLYTLQTHRKSCLFGTGQQEEIPSVEGSSVPFTMCEAEFAQSSIDPKAVQKASPEGEDTEPQIKRPKCSSTAKKSNRKTFQKPKHMCCICGKYVTAGAFEYHMRTHSGERPFSCPHPQCGMKFIYNYDLVEHEKRHSDDRPCLCWECGKAFCTNIDLKQHINSRANHEKTKHGGVRYPCTYCGKQFVCANALKRHDLIHTGERPFKCNHKSCDKAFRSRAELRIHTRYHTGERPFKCNVCGKGFVQANYLTTHYRTHTGEKPYSCSVCDKSFNYHDSLKRHMSTHSNEKPYKCLDCGKIKLLKIAICWPLDYRLFS
uniref:C2H2-type domain-containing protein n=1 Tax=Oncorhynchus mykiss TaxID=8022 RepID=A0A8C7QT18_ONCMY